MKILVVEDDPISAFVLTDALESMGHEATLAENGTEAWTHIRSGAFRVVVSDWMMPEMDGIELCKRIRSMQGLTYLYVILLTAKSQREDRLEALQAGADDFLVKPCDPGQLFARLQVASRIMNLQDEMRSHLMEANRKQIERRGADASSKNTLADAAGLNLRHSELFDALPVACLTVGPDGRVGDYNDACEKMFSLSPHRSGPLTYADVVSNGNEDPADRNTIARVFAGEKVKGKQRVIKRADGQTLRVTQHVSPVIGAGGTVAAAIAVFVETTGFATESQSPASLERAA